MPSPSELLGVARSLLGSPSPPTDAQLRRAVSTAYYALFHMILRSAAIRFMGSGNENTAGYALLYRSFDHRQMRVVCEALDRSTLQAKYQAYLGWPAISRDMRDCATLFPRLQEERHRADYDPGARFEASYVESLIFGAETAMEAFDRAADSERADVLALLMVGGRS